MPSRRTLNPLGAAVLVSLVPCAVCAASECSYQCDTCEEPFYTQSSSDGWGGGGGCVRSEVEVKYYHYDWKCEIDDRTIIHDEASCLAINASSMEGETYLLGHFHPVWDSTTGCHVESTGAHIIGLPHIEGRVCFPVRRWWYILVSQLVAVSLGILFGILSGKFSRKKQSAFVDHLVDMEVFTDAYAKFGPGAKKVAKNTVCGKCQLRYLMFYRFTQVIANVWLPFTLLWLFEKKLVACFWFVLWFFPALCATGFPVLSQPRFFVAPNCSLLGINTDQKTASVEYLFSAMRPLILIIGLFGTSEFLIGIGQDHGVSNRELTRWFINKKAYFNIGFQNAWGTYLVFFTAHVALIGTFLYMVLTIKPVFKALCGMDGTTDFITLEENEELYEDFTSLTDKICEAAEADEKHDESRVDALNVESISRRGACFSLALALIDFFAYIYKVFTFLRDARYLLAGVMTTACVESLTTLWYHGHFKEARHAFERTATTGIPTVHFLALCQWDDGLAGIPALAMSVYGLPLARPSWIGMLSSAFFLITGTKALAGYIDDVEDACMFEVPGEVQEGLLSQTSDLAHEGVDLAKQTSTSAVDLAKKTSTSARHLAGRALE